MKLLTDYLQSRKQRRMEVKDGERHIYANLESCTTSLDSHCKTSQDHHKTACSCPQILINTQMKNLTCLHKKKCNKKKENTHKHGKCEKTSEVHGSHKQPSTVMVDTGSVYEEPEIHSTLHVAGALAQTRKMQPNVSQLLKNKLDSPNTAARLKKQVCANKGTHTNTAAFLFDQKKTFDWVPREVV